MGLFHPVREVTSRLPVITLSILLVFTAGASAFDRISIHESSLLVPQRELTTNPASRSESGAPSSLQLPSDIKLSISPTPAMFGQDRVSLCALRSGRWLAVWQDERLGSEKIFLQQVDSLGTAIGANQMIAGATDGRDFVEPKVAQDTLGRIYLFYRDRTSGLVFGTRYTSALAVDISTFLVNDTSSGGFAGPYDFAIYPDGRVVVVWENYATIGSTIGVRIYNTSGVSVAGPITVNSDGGANPHWVPKVAVQPGSGFLVTWEDYRTGEADILARLYRGDGVPLGNEFGVVPPGPSSSAQYIPQVVWSSTDNYVIGWIDQRDGQEAFLQRYNPASGLVGSNVLASSGDTLYTNWDLNLAVSPLGRTLAVWGASGPTNSILSRWFANGLSPIGLPQVKNLATVGRRWAPSAQFRSASRYGIAWTEYANGDADINLMAFDTTGSRLFANEKILNDDLSGAPATQPCVVNTTSYWNVVAFASRRNDDGDIYTACVNHAGGTTNGNQRVNQDAGLNLQAEPFVTKAPDGIQVVWLDGRAVSGLVGQRIYGRLGNVYGMYSSPEFMISDSSQVAIKSSPKAIWFSSSRGLAVWLDKRSGSFQVYGRWLTTGGALDGSEFLISTPASDLTNADLNIGVDSLGRFYAVWLDAGVSPATVKGRWYNANKSFGGSFSYNATPLGVTLSELSAAINDSGLVTLLWTGTEASTRKLYLTVINRSSTVVRAASEVTDNANALPTEPSLSIDERSYRSATWIDRRSGARRVYYQMMTDQYVPIGSNQAISAATPEFMESPVSFASHGRAWFAWVDPRQDGLNVYANLVVYLPTDAPDNGGSLPNGFALGQNYPNPFNPSTEIEFSLPVRSHVTLTVFNLLGQEVRVLTDETLSAGEHRVTWDGSDRQGNQVASGAYFYRLTAGSSTQTKKMVLVK